MILKKKLHVILSFHKVAFPLITLRAMSLTVTDEDGHCGRLAELQVQTADVPHSAGELLPEDGHRGQHVLLQLLLRLTAAAHLRRAHVTPSQSVGGCSGYNYPVIWGLHGAILGPQSAGGCSKTPIRAFGVYMALCYAIL